MDVTVTGCLGSWNHGQMESQTDGITDRWTAATLNAPDCFMARATKS